jgi:beta-1,4-mannosyltransferase
MVGRNHIVRVGFNYDLMLPSAPRDRAAARRAFGFAPDEVVYLCFGSLRFWEEVCLIRDAFARARVPRKRLFMAGRYLSPGSSWTSRCKRLRWQLWQRRHKILRVTEYVPDNEVPRIFDAADAVVLVRKNSLTSGVPSLAMTFGRSVIAPNIGGIPEILADADNLLYDPTSTYSLVEALERAAHMDREAVGAENRRIADGWKWEDIIRTCLNALPPKTS